MTSLRSISLRRATRPLAVLVALVALSAGVVSPVEAQSAYSLSVSTSPDRSSATSLEAQGESGDIYVFVTPTSGVKRVRFYVDDPSMTGTPFKIEGGSPYDLAGTAKDGTANPLHTGALGDGSHNVTAAIELSGGGTEIVTANFTVENGSEPPSPDSEHTLMMSTSADRSAPVGLDGRTVAGDIYVFVSPAADISRVRFFVDDPAMSGSPFQTENGAPHDLAGTASNGSAKPFDTTQRTDGPHNVTASIDLKTGGTEVVGANFTISNQGVALELAPGSLSFAMDSGETGSQTLTLGTTNTVPATFVVDDNAPWLDVSPSAGVTPATLTAAVDSSGLAAGTYNATVTASAPGFADASVPVELTVGDPGGCSPLACEELLVELPYELDFSQNHGKILDRNGIGTGFTYVDPPSKGDGYIREKLSMDVDAGQLSIDTTKGLMSDSVNSQDNALGVGIDAASQDFTMETRIIHPPAGSGNSEQAGLWFGNDENNYVKLVVLSTRDGTAIHQLVEVNGRRASKKHVGPFALTNAEVRLELRFSPSNRTVTGSFGFGDTPVGKMGTYKMPPEFFSFDGARIDPRIGTDSFGGIFASHRQGPGPLTYVFEEFNVKAVRKNDSSQVGIDFDRSSFPVTMPTSIAWGPDDRLYVTEALGTIHAFTLDANKQPIADEVITTLGTRLTLGITIDPRSTPDNVILWASHSNPSFSEGEPNSSTVTRLSGPGFTDRADVITGLPRAIANHAVNSIHFGPDDKLYIAAGGNTGAGAPNAKTSEFGQMEEQPLSAAILVADVRDPSFDGSCHNPNDIFGPPPCDVVTYSTGLRNSYDFVFHSNGSMYAPDNGLGVTGTYPPNPEPPCLGLADTRSWTQGGDNPGSQPDILVRLEQGKYYGHPNPHRDECVFKDGSFQGVPPLPNYRPPIHVLGNNRSADGTIEYLGDAFCGAVQNELLIANYSIGDDITRIKLSQDGTSVVSTGSLAGDFNDPLPLAQDPDGTIYVGEFGGDKVTALTPQNLGCWSAKEQMPAQLLDVGGTALDGKLFIVGGKTDAGPQSTTYIYDPTTGTWSPRADLPGPAVENPAVAALNGKLYAFGGSTAPFSGAVSNAAVYDPDQNDWSPLSPMPTARGGATVQAVDGLIYVAGGMGGDGASVNTVEIYDPQTDSWTSAAPMSIRRDNPGSAVLDGKLFVFGGRSRNVDGSGDAALISVEMYDPGTDTWSARAPMPSGRRTMSVGTLRGRAQVIGGEIPAGVSGANEEYDPLTDTWKVLTPMKTPRHGTAAGTISGFIYVVAGSPSSGGGFTDLNEAFGF